MLLEKYTRLHNIFPVQFIEDYRPREDQPLLPIPDLQDNKDWEIEEVKNKATIKGQLHYLVKWKGWPTEYNQWIANEDMKDAQ